MTSFTDNFSREEDPLASGWAGGAIGALYTTGTDVKVDVDGSNASGVALYYIPACSVDQSAELSGLVMAQNTVAGIVLRHDSSTWAANNFWYGRTIMANGVNQGTIEVWKRKAGGSSTLEATSGTSATYWNPGSVGLHCDGTTITCSTDKGSANDNDADVPGNAGADYFGFRMQVLNAQSSGVLTASIFGYADT